MKTFQVIIKETYYATYTVEADSEEHAKELVSSANVEQTDLCFSHMDEDSNNWSVGEI